VKTVRLGKTELMVTEVGLGGIPIIPLTEAEAVSVIRHCYDLGIRFFDTANNYRDSEEKMGAALENLRDNVIIATKTAIRNSKEASEHIDLSLQRLRTDRIDIYQLHNISNNETFDQVLAPGGAYEALDKARTEGKIHFIGFSSHSIPIAMKTLNTGLFQTLQFPFNFIEKDPADELFPLAQKMDVGLIGMKPLGGGLLERADLCFGFLRQHPYVVPIPGMCKQKEADEIVGFYHAPKALAQSDLEEMDAIRAALGDKFCHRCQYCMPCEQGVQIPGVLIFKGFAKRFSQQVATEWMEKAMQSVEECIECGECEEKCPYNLAIIDLLKENLSLYHEFLKNGNA
jgi:predicted aldo/keto reductase-like oxidoreductase